MVLEEFTNPTLFKKKIVTKKFVVIFEIQKVI